MIYLHKVIALIASPLFLIIFLIFLGIIFKSKKISLLGFIVLIFCSLPITSSKLISYLEKDYILQNISNIDKADAIVVLSGMLKTIKFNNKLEYEFNEKVDRILSGIDLFKNDKAPLLILTRGKFPWLVGVPEGEYLKNFAMKFGIPEESIFLTDSVQNTHQEAKSVKKLLNSNEAKIILVTSAFHMPRAKRVFESYNIKVIPFAVDFINTHSKLTIIDFIPSASSFLVTSIFVREMIGRLYYSLKY
ncbi:YdcF family protein [Candidatus Pelagibacter sp.]|nr:YdcF family protein [Candidatus Pelagibacter sp.]